MDKKFMNKMDDMELDMVAGGGLFDTLKEAIKQVSKPPAKTLKGLIETAIDGLGYDIVPKLIGKFYKKVCG
ncbi:hypothetical protein SAMN04487861_1111 [Selenomonas ruminantium]|uniref:Uncharacterized protein n=1 Tax=Selenomonas ruminantium TaxID=971 RepID=A0A1I3ENM9_SELRU|nr:hypothetical protein [Selenomonas ruminantium]SFI00483.1 hypothetical protein SAMN04487861_1111 [Selenomonas ruminantium]